MQNAFERHKKAEAIRVLLADDCAMLLEGLRALFDLQPDIQVIGTCRDGESALRLALELKPNVLLLDISMSKMSGMEVLRELSLAEATTKAIVLTGRIDRKEVVESIRLGARGIVLKHTSFDLLANAVRCVMSGEYWVERSWVSDLAKTVHELSPNPSVAVPQPLCSLTSRERDIVAAVLSGCTNKEIAQKHNISDQTVKNHLTAIYDKIGVSSRLELALFATRYGLAA